MRSTRRRRPHCKTHVISYQGILEQALRDLSAWTEPEIAFSTHDFPAFGIISATTQQVTSLRKATSERAAPLADRGFTGAPLHASGVRTWW